MGKVETRIQSSAKYFSAALCRNPSQSRICPAAKTIAAYTSGPPGTAPPVNVATEGVVIVGDTTAVEACEVVAAIDDGVVVGVAVGVVGVDVGPVGPVSVVPARYVVDPSHVWPNEQQRLLGTQ